MSEDSESSLLDLPPDIADRVVAKLSDRGKKAVAALRTAAVLIAQAVHDETGLRLAEGAAYSLREALDAVVTGRIPSPGGLPLVIQAWAQFEREQAQPGNDDVASLETFGMVMRSTTKKQDRNSYHEAKLLGYLRDKSGVEPLFGGLDPIGEYKRLRRTASQGLHQETALEAVHDRTWSSLTAQTLITTEGVIDYAIEVADRCETVPIPGASTRILLLLQGRGELWEQHHIGRVALNALRTLSAGRPDENFSALRTRLIELGYDEAADLNRAVAQRPSAQ
ncbi:hypothetical protein [Streptomyces sp. NPDC058603]|uniref:hypothetical protein n=1 Tax=Streptomyces sp. NPDC058603 TaxID=3346551 RepID=UPI00365A0314